MAKEDQELLAFNRGIVSRLALGRVDVKRVAMSAQEQTNFIPRVLGPMSLRPGLEYIGATHNNAVAHMLPFIFSTTDTALIELTGNVMRVWTDEALVTRPSVATAVTNGTFTTDLTGWTDGDEVGGASTWATGGYMALLGSGTAAAIRDQTVSVALADQNVEHALNVEVLRGELILRVSSTAVGGDNLITETTLRAGTHSLAFTPTTAAIYIRLQARLSRTTFVSSCTIAPAGIMTLVTPWAESDLPSLRYKQSGDVIFLACNGLAPKRIERRSARAWSLVDYENTNGPFRVGNSSPITLAISALKGEATITASKDIFKSTNVGSLFAINSTGQTVTSTLSAADTYTDPIRVTGIGAGRLFGFTISGTWVGTVTLQRSVGDIGAWVTVADYTTNQSSSLNDTLDNQIIYYRLGIRPAAYTSGSAISTLTYSAGTIKGVARVTDYTSSTVVAVQVIKDFGALTATVDWSEGAWSARRGYPSAIGLHEGRVWWAGKDKINGSVSDDFANFDSSVVGDSAPISRSIGAGPVDTINWLLESQQLLVGAQGAELICRSSSLGEPLTPTNFNLKEASSRGSNNVDAVKVDTSGVFVDRSGSRVYELAYDTIGTTYTAADLTAIAPEIGLPSITNIGIQRRPDTRLHFVRADGKVAMLVFDKTEDVKAWILVETDGSVEDSCVLPGTEEDRVYYTVARTINGNTVRYLEKWAKQSECVGGTTNKQADAFRMYSGAATNTITGLNHLEGESVVCWADGKDRGTYTVSGGSITLASPAVTSAIVGLTYRARYRSVKFRRLTKRKKVDDIGLILMDTHYQGLSYGQEFDYLDDMPLVERETETAADTVWEDYDFDSMTMNGTFDTNARLCLEANAPRPCTVVACIIGTEENDK